MSKNLILLDKFTELLTFAPINNMVLSIGTMGFGSMPRKERNIVTPTISYIQKNWIEKTVYLLKLAVKSPLVSPRIPSAFTPYPLFQWYSQSKKFMLNLSMYDYSSCTGRSSENICRRSGGAQEKGKTFLQVF